MSNSKHLDYLQQVLNHIPKDWLKLTTHRLDIYNEAKAKTEFTEAFENLFQAVNFRKEVLAELPTAFDYIRLGHPLSCVLEWTLGKNTQLDFNRVIAFSSKTMPIMAVLRKNHFSNVKTRICYSNHLPNVFDVETVRRVYGYDFEIEQIKD
ncbi:MAG: cystathionine beta-synthase, partial [Cryomorphaceae bacterium]|nr:cystathionine beta-synthase [Cryomorphaceae bacterium]